MTTEHPAMTDDTPTPTLTEHLDAAHAEQLAALTTTDALDVADRLRAIAAALDPDAYTAALADAAVYVERRAGII